MTIAFRQLLGYSQRHPARNDRDLVHGIGIGNFQSNQCVAGFVISGDALFFVRDDHAFALGAHQDFILGQFEIRHGYNLLVVASRIQSRLINKIRQIGPGEARSAARDHADVNVFAQWNLARVNLQDPFAAAHVRTRNHYTAIEPPWPEQRGIENVWTVSRSD